jgi:hypothetical protein
MFNYTEIIGYFGSAMILLSFMMKDMKTLRWVSILGCVIFIVYGSMIGAIPIVITNSAIVFVNLYYLFFKKLD